MSAAALASARLTSLVLPVACCQEDNVNAPDNYGMARLNRLRGVDQITPNHVPARMIVVGLDRPRARTALGLEGLLRRWIEFPVQGQIRESLLRDIGVLVFFVGADRMQRPYTEDTNNAAKYIGLFQIQVY